MCPVTKYSFDVIECRKLLVKQCKDFDDLCEAHLYALRIFERLFKFIPDQISPTCRIKITPDCEEPVLTVVLPALATEKRFQKLVGP